jgi:flagellar assembly factor FliW
MEPQVQTTSKMFNSDLIVRFNEGLIGFADCKEFVLVENEELKPFRLLQSAESTELGFVVLDPAFRVGDYNSQIPAREWDSIGVTDPAKRLAFVIVNIGVDPRESTGNFQAPLLINYEKMTGRQVILTDTSFCLRQSLVG